MGTETVSNKQGISVMLLFLLGSNLVIGTAGPAKRDAWLAILVAMIAAQGILLIYARILSLCPGNSIFDINEKAFGKFLGKLINIVYIVFPVHLGAIVLNNFAEFISTIGLSDTPKTAPVIFITILCIWASKEGIEVIGRWSSLFVIIIMLIMSTATLLSIPRWNVDNIRPILHCGFIPFLNGSLSAFFFPFGDSMVFLMLFESLERKTSPLKIYVLSSVFCGVTLTILTLRNVMVLGEELITKNYYPSYIAISRISIGDFLERIETIVMVAFLIAGFVKISCCLLAASKGISRIFDFKDYRFLVTPVGLIIAGLSFNVFENMQENVTWNEKFMPYYMSIYVIIIVLITYMRAEIYFKKHKPNKV